MTASQNNGSQVAPVAKTAIPVVFGAMTFGDEGFEGARTSKREDEKEILDILQSHGHDEIDTARMYTNGTSEQHLGALGWQERGLRVDTKIFPGIPLVADEAHDHTPAGIRYGLELSLKALNARKINIYYLHAPDHTVPFEGTLRALNDLYLEGKFARLGLSNFKSWEVAQVVEICIRNHWVRPTVYQAVYSAIQRSIEPELIPCLRAYDISLYTYAPLAGGALTGRYKRHQRDFEKGSRMDPATTMGQFHQGRYLHDAFHDAMDLIAAAASRHDLTVAECGLRWIQHHSQLAREWGDKVIIGASSAGQLRQNLADFEKGPLPVDVVEALDQAWLVSKPRAASYYLAESRPAGPIKR